MLIPHVLVGGQGVGIGITETAKLLIAHPELKPLIGMLAIEDSYRTIVEIQANLYNAMTYHQLHPQTIFKTLSVRESVIMWTANREHDFRCQFIVHVNTECGTESYACYIENDEIVAYEAHWDETPNQGVCRLVKLAC